MSLAEELVGSGFSPSQASNLGGVYTTFAAAGNSQATATMIGASMSIVTGADGTKGVILSGQPGDQFFIMNNSGSSLLVYPTTGAAIAVPGSGMGTVNAAYTQTTYAACTYKFLTSTQWIVIKSA